MQRQHFLWRSSRPSCDKAVNSDQVITNGGVGTACQPADKIRQLAGVMILDRWPWVDAMSDLVTVRHRIREPLDRLRREVQFCQFHDKWTSAKPRQLRMSCSTLAAFGVVEPAQHSQHVGARRRARYPMEGRAGEAPELPPSSTPQRKTPTLRHSSRRSHGSTRQAPYCRPGFPVLRCAWALSSSSASRKSWRR